MDQKPYNYKFTSLAEEDLNNIFDYIAGELSSAQAAEILLDKIQASVERICVFPFSCQLLNNEFLQEKGYRLLVVDSFNLFYIIQDEIVVIMRVLYGKRSYDKLLW